MKSKLFQKVVMILISFWTFVPGAAGQADERLMEVVKLSQQGKPEQALAAGRIYLKDLRKTLPEADHPAIGYAAVIVGMAASKAGEHEEAVRLLREGLPIFNRMRAGQLWAEELSLSEPLVASLEALKRTDEALAVLEDLLGRTRKELARRPNAGGLKADQPGGPAVALDAMMVNEDSLAALLERSGILKLELNQWGPAEKDLKEAEQIVRRLHPDEQQARLVKLREGWEQAARKLGKSIRPHLVGRFSIPRVIRIKGNAVISTDEIRTALTRSSVYMLASHPSAEFDGYLKKLQRCLELGYLATGFPEAAVKVDWDHAQDAVVAGIVEGPRFKAGEIRIQGEKVLTAERLLVALKFEPDAEDKPVGRARESYEKIIEQKRLQGDQTGKSLMEVFPENFVKPADGDEGKPSVSDFMTESDLSTKGVWEKDEWVDYQPSFLDSAENLVRSAYAKEGIFFPKFELKLVPGAAPDTMDLLVEVVEEGPALRLGKLHVAGNRVNTREELLAYLGLEEGMELKGDYIGLVKRRLYESGRFLGWEVVSRRAPTNPGKIDILIEVAEEWEAPPLSQPLTREQDLMLKFAKWMNTEAGEESDLVFSVSQETELGPMALSIAMGREAMSLSADGLGHHIRMIGVQDKDIEFVIQTDQGSSFRALFPVASSPLAGTLEIMRTHRTDPFVSKGWLSMGMAASSNYTNLLRFTVDPAAALSLCASSSNGLTRFENGELIMEIGDGGTLRLDARSGHLISVNAVRDEGVFECKSETGEVARIGEEAREMARGAENWAKDKSPFSLFYLAMGYALELVGDEDFGKAGSFGEHSLRAAAERSKRWEPLAVFLGDITAHISEALGSIKERMESSKDAGFSIPMDRDEMSAKLKAGGTLSVLLALGAYDMLAEFIEPGTWPDLVSREILFYLDGKPFYQNQSIETLLEDDSMGPLGSLLCANLLKQVGNPAAARFVSKARAGLTDEGFAKDWTPVLRGTAGDNGIGWKILKAIRQLDDQKIDGFLPADPPEFRSTLKNMVAEVGKMKAGTNAETIRPVVNKLWDAVLKTAVEDMIDDMEKSLTPQMDPAIVAATVNGFPVLRGAVRVMERLEGRILIQQAFPLLRKAWNLEGAGSPQESCVTTLLLAQQMWAKGQSAMPDFVNHWAGKIADDLGEDGCDQIAKLGLPEERFKWWVGTLIAAEACCVEFSKKQITDKEVRAFFDAHKQVLGVGDPECRLYTIRLKLEDDNLGLAQNIRQQVNQAESMDAKVKVFMDLAKKHSNETDTKDGGERGWVRLSDEFNQPVAVEMAKVPEQSLSEVIQVKLGGQDYLYLALIPEKKRPGKAKPFEEMAPQLSVVALLDRETKLLKKQADVRVLDEPIVREPGKDLAKPATGKAAEKGMAGLADGLISGWKSVGETDGKKKNTGEKKEKLSLELITRKAAEGSAYHIYLMGTCIERGLTPEGGVQKAIKLYEKAAEAGERKAMLRLSEIHRTGRGVDPNDDKAREWKDKAFACPPFTDE